MKISVYLADELRSVEASKTFILPVMIKVSFDIDLKDTEILTCADGSNVTKHFSTYFQPTTK